MKPIAHIHTDFTQKFGVPRQSGLAPACKATITFDEPYNNPLAVRGLEEYSHIWLIWEFQGTDLAEWKPLVRPPRLGGDKKVGVFASRSPYRPNALGLSSVRLERVEITPAGAVLHVAGADLRDNTPIWDIKPYLPLADCHTDATGGFTDTHAWQNLSITLEAPAACQWEAMDEGTRAAITQVLEQDPRPAHNRDHRPDKVFRLGYGAYDVAFTVDDGIHQVHITEIRAVE